MILKILLALVFVKLLTDRLWIKEGIGTEDMMGLGLRNVTKYEPTNDPSVSTRCSTNILFPQFVEDKKFPNKERTGIYTNDNNFMYNNFRNIQKVANPDMC
jgi:hypothetical protein